MVTVSFDASGNSRTRRPLPSVYSVMPSTAVTWRGGAGRAAGGGASLAAGGGGGAGGVAAGGGEGAGAAIAEPSDPSKPTTNTVEAGAFTRPLYRGPSSRWRV